MTLKFNRILEVVELRVRAEFHQAKWAVHGLSTVH